MKNQIARDKQILLSLTDFKTQLLSEPKRQTKLSLISIFSLNSQFGCQTQRQPKHRQNHDEIIIEFKMALKRFEMSEKTKRKKRKNFWCCMEITNSEFCSFPMMIVLMISILLQGSGKTTT